MEPSISPWLSIPKSSVPALSSFVCAGTLPQTRPVCGSWLIQSSWNHGNRGRQLQLEKQRAPRESSHGVFCTCPGYFLKEVAKFLIFYIFLNLGKADITIEFCFQLTSGVLSYPPMYFVIKCFCKCVKCIIIVLPLESLRLRLDRHQEKKKQKKQPNSLELLVQCDRAIFILM